MRLQHFAYLIIGVFLFTSGLDANKHLSPEMSDALQLLRPTERLRFGAMCLQEKYCTHAELLGFGWEEQSLDTAVLNRFWHTYSCTFIENVYLCPVDGGWSAWGEWGDCHVTCGDGTKTRQRICNWPEPQNGGNECHGQTTSVTSCTVIPACPQNETEGGSIEDSVQKKALKLMEPFNTNDAELRNTCMTGRCSYQQVLEMVTPRNLADTYWTNLNCYKHLEGCAVEGGWSEWNPWSSCSSQCGSGKAYRSRRCNNPQPRHGGHHCRGPEYEEGACVDDTCALAVGIFLTPWSTWTACSTSCNDGLKTSSRRCHGGDACDVGNGHEASILTRETPCNSGLCPEHGGWSMWSEWTVCTGMCSKGRQVRERTCNNPRPQGKGNDCPGESAMLKKCTHSAPFCEGLPKRKQLHEAWSQWSDCSSLCDGGMRIRHRTCPEQKHACSGELYGLEVCNDDIPCPANGGWSEWSQWSVCTVTCGDGEIHRFRLCNNPRPEFGGSSCEGESDEKKSCIVQECPANTPTWESWSPWSQCSATCGGGFNERARVCLPGRVTVGESNRMLKPPSSNCVGENTQMNVCNFLPCPVNGNWASWGDWGSCSKTCGEGVLKRDRTCTDPAPAGTGEVCGGYGTEMLLCYTQPCPATDEIVRTFDGSSFMMYRRASKPTKHLLLYIQFKPSTLSGVLALRNEEGSDQTVSVGLADGHVKMYAKVGEAESEVVSEKQVVLDEWNRIEATISGGNTHLRLNDGIPTFSNFTIALPKHLDWDLPMYIGGALPQLFPKPAPEYVGFRGSISALRVNYNMYTLHEVNAEWTGIGLPYVSFNVGFGQADINSQVPVFTGQEFTSLPCNASTDGKLSIKVILKPLAPDGLILYHPGKVPESFVALVMLDGHVTLYLNLGFKTMSAKSAEVDLSNWVIVQLTILGGNAEMRINGGPAIQVTVEGRNFVSSDRVDVGSVPAPDVTAVSMSMDVYTGYVGALYEVTINDNDYLLRDAALSRHDVYVDSESTTLAAHYREVRKPRHEIVALQCNYANVYTEKPTITWIMGDKMIESDHNFKVFESMFQPYMSSLLLHALDTDNEGLYACVVGYRGKAILTHAFGVSVFEPHRMSFDMQSALGYAVMAYAGLICSFVISVFFLSCFKCLRLRFFFFDLMYESIIYYLGLDSWACMREGNVFDHHTLMTVDATYHKNFSAREEKIKFDQALAEEKKNKKQLEATTTSQTLAPKLSRNGVSQDAEKNMDTADDTGIQNGGKDAESNKVSKVYIMAQRDEGSGTSNAPKQYDSAGKRPSSRSQSNDIIVEVEGQNLTRRPSESLSDKELNLRRLSHEIVSGRPESSTSGSSLGRAGSAPPADENSPGPLILLEEEDDNHVREEQKEEPIYVNIDAIRERQRLSKASTSSLRVSKGESSESFDTDHPPGLDSPNTRERLQKEEPVEVDMDAVRENWQRSMMSIHGASPRASTEHKEGLVYASRGADGADWEPVHDVVKDDNPSGRSSGLRSSDGSLSPKDGDEASSSDNSTGEDANKNASVNDDGSE